MRLLPYLLVLLAEPAAAQVTVSATADRSLVAVGEVVAYTLEVEGDLSGLGDVRAPAAEGLVLTQAAPAFRARVRTGGHERLTLRWLYEAVAPGPARIGGVRLPLRRRVLTTDPVTLTVRATPPPRPVPPPDPDPAPVAEDLFVRAEPSVRRAFVGQQVVVTYVLYFEPHLGPRRAQTLGGWDAPGTWREEMEVGPDETFPRTTRVGGRTLAAVTLRRVALFPTRAGRLTVGPMTFEVDVVRSSPMGGPFGSFFDPFSSRLEGVRLTAPELALDVDALPAGAPAAFGGAVGTFGMAAALDRDRVAVGEAARLTITLAGSGNTAALDPPAVVAPPGFETFGPDADREVDRRRVPLESQATFTYTLVPRGGGRFEIPPVAFAYFDPEAGAYRTLTSAPLPLEVTGPPLAGGRPGGPAAPMTTAEWRPASAEGRPSGWWLVGGAVAPLAALGAMAVRRRDGGRRRTRADRTNAHAALRAETDREPAAFYAALDRALREAAAGPDASPTRSRRDLADALEARSVPPDARAEFDALLRTAEQARFAPGAPPDHATRRAHADRAAALLTRLRSPGEGAPA